MSASSRLVALCAGLQRAIDGELSKLDRVLYSPSIELSSENQEVSSVTTPPSRKSSFASSVPKNVRMIYYNNCSRALKITQMNLDINPLLLSPTSLIPGYAWMSSMTAALSQTLNSVRHQFPHSPAVYTSSTDPIIVRAMNHVREILSGRYSKESGGASEVCLRVRSGYRGGHWVIGRMMSDRVVYLIIDRCETMNDLYQCFTQTIDGAIANVIM